MVGLGCRDCVKRPATCDIGMSDVSVSGYASSLMSSPAACVRSDRNLVLRVKRWLQQTKSLLLRLRGAFLTVSQTMERLSGAFEVHSFRGTWTSSQVFLASLRCG